MPNDGSYVITEQGDLGLGLTAVNEQDIKTPAQRENDQKNKEKENDLY